jgi:hypothetical protein
MVLATPEDFGAVRSPALTSSRIERDWSIMNRTQVGLFRVISAVYGISDCSPGRGVGPVPAPSFGDCRGVLETESITSVGCLSRRSGGFAGEGQIPCLIRRTGGRLNQAHGLHFARSPFRGGRTRHTAAPKRVSTRRVVRSARWCCRSAAARRPQDAGVCVRKFAAAYRSECGPGGPYGALWKVEPGGIEPPCRDTASLRSKAFRAAAGGRRCRIRCS